MIEVAAVASMQTDERYRLLVESISDYAIYMLDPSGRVVSWNPGARRFKGYEAAEILGHHFSRFYTDEDRASGVPERALRTAVQEGRFESEGWRVRKDGTRFWANVVIDPIMTPKGGILGFAKITRDLTERRKAEQELREAERRFRYLVQGVTDYAIYMLDPEGYVTNWNAGAQKIKGYMADEIVGQHFSRFYVDKDREAGEPARALATARANGRYEKEGERVRKDGTHFFANVVIDAIYNDAGELIGFAKVTRDITERRRSEQALAQATEELLQSQKMEAIGRLTGGVAHDFNNLLSAISGSLELLRKRIDDERQLKLIDNAMRGAQRGASLTQRMLAFARRQELKPASADIGELVKGMVDLLQSSLGPSIDIELRFPAALPPVLIDVNQLELAIINLAVNASDAMPDGGRLSIAAREETGAGAAGLEPGRYVRLSVTDSGTGMDAETLAHATEPFFTTKGVGKGTGLGLAMVRGLSEQSGGTVTIDSEPGKGTTVALWIPAADSAPEVAVPIELPSRAAEPQSLKVLVVDDDLLVAMNTASMLEDLGHRVVEVHSGKLALEAWAASPDFDLVITDQAMPHMTGTQLISALRDRAPELPIVLATGYAELPPDAELVRAVPRLNKPFLQGDVERVLAEVAAGR